MEEVGTIVPGMIVPIRRKSDIVALSLEANGHDSLADGGDHAQSSN